jgi:segregation and condensation protein B
MLDVELADLPREMRRRQFLGRIEAVVFPAPAPVKRETLARVIGTDCNIDEFIDDLRAEPKGKAFELVTVAGGWQMRTLPTFFDAIQVAAGVPKAISLSKSEGLLLTANACFQPITRGEQSQIFGYEISRDLIG